jgi:threonyl-tRNA synthetase
MKSVLTEGSSSIIKGAMAEAGYPYVEAAGEAAFYGPKVDFMIKSAIGTEYTISTNQLDFLSAETFGLTYIGEDSKEYPVYVIHRAPLGSHERFIAFLLEHYAGDFPTWLSPVQVRIIPIADRHAEYANSIKDKLFTLSVTTGTGGLRVDIDLSAERMQKKIRNAQLAKVPYMLIVGDAETRQDTVSVRHRSGRDFGAVPLDSFIARICEEITSRRDKVE